MTRMVIQDLQKFLESQVKGACVPVDLLKIARSICIRRDGSKGPVRGPYESSGNSHLTLIVDGECCLDRLYGGFFSDWVCGGQWNRMVQFLLVLIQTIQSNNIDLTVFFNGALEQQRLREWSQIQCNIKKNINLVLKHIAIKGTPPPKIWWVPPVGLQTCLRLALRHLNVQVGSLETKEFILDEVARGLGLQRNHFCFLAALLGNYLLTEDDLQDFYATLIPEYSHEQTSQEEIIKAVVKFINLRCDVDNLMTVGAQVFGSVSDPRVAKFKESVQYFLNGTKDGFLRYQQHPRLDITQRSVPLLDAVSEKHSISSTEITSLKTHEKHEIQDSDKSSSGLLLDLNLAPQIVIESPKRNSVVEIIKDDEETVEHSEPKSSNLEHTLESNLGMFKIVVTGSEADSTEGNKECKLKKRCNSNIDDKSQVETSVTTSDIEDHDYDSGGGYIGSQASGSPGASLLLSSSSSSSNSSATSPYRLTPDVSWATQVYRSNQATPSNNNSDATTPVHSQPPLSLGENESDFYSNPPVPHEVMRTASERHQKGLMCPWIYQVLSHGEVKFGLCLEDESHREIPDIMSFYRPIRQNVYAILFNLHHYSFLAKKAKEEGSENIPEVPVIKIREWCYSNNNPYLTPEIIEAVPVNWAAPTVQRLWFGSVMVDKKRRLRAFLSCMRSDAPLMLQTTHVPQDLLILATVLRYILTNAQEPILRKQELDAFIATAFSSDLKDAHYLQDLQVPGVTSRGVQLASLLMMGVETALFVNDACGAPVPWVVCCPWLFFDGKLFHSKLVRANYARSLVDVCEGQLDLVAKVERCRQAILEGLHVEFIQLPLPPLLENRIAPGPFNSMLGGPPQMPAPPLPPPPPPSSSSQRGRGRGSNGSNRLYARGGQLQVAGYVVGSWGPNYGSGAPSRLNRFQENDVDDDEPNVMANTFYNRGRGQRGRPTFLAKRRGMRWKEPTRTLHHKTSSSSHMFAFNEARSLHVDEFIRQSQQELPNGYPPQGMSCQSGIAPVCEQGNLHTSPYSHHLPPHSHTSNGLKSPDSGVNVSILE